MTPEQKNNAAFFVDQIKVKPRDRADFLDRHEELKDKPVKFKIAKIENVASKVPKVPK